MTLLRARFDEWHTAGRWRAILLGAVPDPREDRSVSWDPDFLTWIDRHEEARMGDVWTFRQKPSGPDIVYRYGEPEGDHAHWPVTHYALVCPVVTCEYGVHAWSHAHNCPARDKFGADCKRGVGRKSCWDWSGSIAGHDLTADPSLQILPLKPKPGPGQAPVTRRTCEFHGHLKAGIMGP